jgi:prolyl oligopeptidase
LNEKSANSSTNTTAFEEPKTRNYIKFTPMPKMTPLIPDWIGEFSAIHTIGTKFFFQTNLDSPNSKVIMIDLNDPTKHIDVLPERKDSVLQSASVQNNKLLVKYMVNASDSLQIFDLGLDHP